MGFWTSEGRKYQVSSILAAKSCHFVFICLFTCLKAFCQDGIKESYLTKRYLVERVGAITSVSNTLLGIPLPAPEIKGDYFISPHFNFATLVLDDNKAIDSCYVMYDIVKDVFFLKQNDGFYGIKGARVNGFSWLDSLSGISSTFVNCKLFSDKNASTQGFYEVLCDGPIALVSKTEVEIKEANFSIALNVGRSDHEIIKKTTKYVIREKQILELPAPKKVPLIFGPHSKMIADFIKLNDLDVSLDNHLIAVFKYYNSKFSTL